MFAEKMFNLKPDIDFKRRRTVNPTIKDHADNDATSIKARNRRRRTTKQKQNNKLPIPEEDEDINKREEDKEEDVSPAVIVEEAFNTANPDAIELDT